MELAECKEGRRIARIHVAPTPGVMETPEDAVAAEEASLTCPLCPAVGLYCSGDLASLHNRLGLSQIAGDSCSRSQQVPL